MGVGTILASALPEDIHPVDGPQLEGCQVGPRHHSGCSASESLRKLQQSAGILHHAVIACAW